MEGWIRVYRKMLANPVVMKDAEHLAVWVWLLLNATHTPYDTLFGGKKITLSKGQLVTGRVKIAQELKVSESKVERILKCFESEHQIEQQKSNKNRLITLINWNKYQRSEQQNEQQLNNNWTTSEQQVNTNNNVNNIENKKNEKEDGNIAEQKNADDRIEEIKEIIEYLNLRKGSGYSYKTVSTQRMIRGRLNEGYTVEDFKAVIDAKCAQWLKDPKMVEYLQPSTLFAPSHFESYLQQSKVKRPMAAGTQQRTMQLLAEYQKQIEQEEANEEE